MTPSALTALANPAPLCYQLGERLRNRDHWDRATATVGRFKLIFMVGYQCWILSCFFRYGYFFYLQENNEVTAILNLSKNSPDPLKTADLDQLTDRELAHGCLCGEEPPCPSGWFQCTSPRHSTPAFMVTKSARGGVELNDQLDCLSPAPLARRPAPASFLSASKGLFVPPLYLVGLEWYCPLEAPCRRLNGPGRPLWPSIPAKLIFMDGAE